MNIIYVDGFGLDSSSYAAIIKLLKNKQVNTVQYIDILGVLPWCSFSDDCLKLDVEELKSRGVVDLTLIQFAISLFKQRNIYAIGYPATWSTLLVSVLLVLKRKLRIYSLSDKQHRESRGKELTPLILCRLKALRSVGLASILHYLCLDHLRVHVIYMSPLLPCVKKLHSTKTREGKTAYLVLNRFPFSTFEFKRLSGGLPCTSLYIKELLQACRSLEKRFNLVICVHPKHNIDSSLISLLSRHATEIFHGTPPIEQRHKDIDTCITHCSTAMLEIVATSSYTWLPDIYMSDPDILQKIRQFSMLHKLRCISTHEIGELGN
jgi:hypothetical protein